MIINNFKLIQKSTIIQIINNVVSWITIYFIVDLNGLESLYYFILIGSINQIIATISEFGTSEYVLIKSSKINKNSLPIAGNIFYLSIITSLTIYLILLPIFQYFDKQFFYTYLILGLNSIFFSFSIIINHLIGSKKLDQCFFIRIILFIFYLSIFLAIDNATNKEIYILFTLYNFLTVIIFQNFFIKKIYFRKIFIMKIIKKNFLIFISNFFLIIKTRGIIIVLNFFLTELQLSFYGLITRIIEAFNLISAYAIKIFSLDIISNKKFKNLFLLHRNINFIFLFNIFLISLILINFQQILDLDKLSTHYNYTFLIYISLYLSLVKIQENLFKINSINKSLMNIVFKSTLISSLLSVILTITLSFNYELFGAFIAYIISAHLIFYLNNFFYKDKI
jgi:hypothetical protein